MMQLQMVQLAQMQMMQMQMRFQKRSLKVMVYHRKVNGFKDFAINWARMASPLNGFLTIQKKMGVEHDPMT